MVLKAGLLAVLLMVQPGPAPAAEPGLAQCAVPPMASVELDLPRVAIDPGLQAAMARFREAIRLAARGAPASPDGSIRVLAPAGGSKLRPMLETHADDLFILSWERPGTPASIIRTFRQQAKPLAALLQSGVNSGSQSTEAVDQLPVAAQILGLIGIELGVREVAVAYYLPKGSPVDFSQGERLLALWDGPPVTETEVPLLTVFRFAWRGRPRRVLFYSWRLTPDTSPRREALPVADLHRLNPRGFDWGYLSADGLMFFSALADNQGLRADRQLLDALVPGGLVLLDYPLGAWCHQPYWAGGFRVMGGRAPLEDWGLRRLRAIPVTEPVFGYSGFTPNDTVCVYQKPPVPAGPVRAAPPDGADFIAIGPAHRFALRPPAPA